MLIDKDELFASIQEEEANVLQNEFDSFLIAEGDSIQRHQHRRQMYVESINIGICY